MSNFAKFSLSSCYSEIKPYTRAIIFQQDVIISDLSPRQILVGLDNLRGTNFNKTPKEEVDKLIIEGRSRFHENIFPIYEKYVKGLLKE